MATNRKVISAWISNFLKLHIVVELNNATGENTYPLTVMTAQRIQAGQGLWVSAQQCEKDAISGPADFASHNPKTRTTTTTRFQVPPLPGLDDDSVSPKYQQAGIVIAIGTAIPFIATGRALSLGNSNLFFTPVTGEGTTPL